MRKRTGEDKLTKTLFDQLVSNAIDFFSSSVKQIKSRPKYSVINFCSGLEITLKARLSREHWSLIVKRPEEASLIKLQNGDFASVTVDETLKRLENVVGESFSEQEKKAFEKIRDHRNKVVHFHHNAYSAKGKTKILEDIAGEQCTAWFYLNRRLTGPWASDFRSYSTKFAGLDKKLHEHRIFLEAKYCAMKPSFDKEIAAGRVYSNCQSCGFPSGKISEKAEPVFQSDCQVCGAIHTVLRISCPGCGEETPIDDLDNEFCRNEDCETEINLAHVIDATGSEKDSLSYCADCQQVEETVISMDRQYFCLWCKGWFDSIDECGYCGISLVGFDSDLSGLFGCFMCEEAAAEHFEKM